MRKKQSKDLTSNGNYAILHLACGRGGTGRRVRLRGVWETVWVQVPSTAPNKNKTNLDENSKFVLFFTRDLLRVFKLSIQNKTMNDYKKTIFHNLYLRLARRLR